MCWPHSAALERTYVTRTLDELAVYPTELSQARVTAHRTAAITP